MKMQHSVKQKHQFMEVIYQWLPVFNPRIASFPEYCFLPSRFVRLFGLILN
jgi:hypothetical protein